MTDALIKRFESVLDGDLAFTSRGIAYQRSMASKRVEYGPEYFAKVEAYDGTSIAKAVNAGRIDLLRRHLPEGAKVLDWGAGSCAFVRDASEAGFAMSGWDVMLQSQQRLDSRLSQDPYLFDAVTMWDVIEHLEQPSTVIKKVRKGAKFFVSLPVFDDLAKVRESKHYRPGEHLYYFTSIGFVSWMALWGFRLLEQSWHEVDAGRESIGAFAFCRDLPDYHDHIAAYKQMHSMRHYGSSATGEYLTMVADVVRELKPRSILDYGCGRSDLVAHFWLDGERRIERYDPAIGPYKVIPEGRFDLVLCCDVMEHIPMQSVDQVLAEVQARGDTALFTISVIPARAKLPDGRNAHVTLLSKEEWTRWARDVFTRVRVLRTKHDHELVLIAGARA